MNKSVRYTLCLDLVDEPGLIAEYEAYHQQVWPEILLNMKAAGILSAEIYRWQNRLCMILETTPEFSFDHKAMLDQSNKKVIEWEKLMWKYQQSLPGVLDGSKWQLMQKIFRMD
ncbi:L-rhamnose mutarotase [Anditalea andensis]|uniref:L-fucose mutarotase n=1 Tax=Anditalea andensis TaxID=1048983 RepID=A0A074KUL7_9BACT|nr:L-rhamnose mutarotase [Anditalea andensis]KEO71970.1 hypothetical protein EL17_20870 [Anditalea andensis]